MLAFEPVAEHQECWRANMVDAPNAQLVCCALGEHGGTVYMANRAPGSSGDTGIDPIAERSSLRFAVQAKGEPVPMRTLDDFDLPVLDFLKLDCEGYEVFIVRGARETLTRCKPCVMVEQKPEVGHVSRYGIGLVDAVNELKRLRRAQQASSQGRLFYQLGLIVVTETKSSRRATRRASTMLTRRSESRFAMHAGWCAGIRSGMATRLLLRHAKSRAVSRCTRSRTRSTCGPTCNRASRIVRLAIYELAGVREPRQVVSEFERAGAGDCWQRADGPFVVIEPSPIAKSNPNKAWPREKFAGLVAACPDVRFVQLHHPESTSLDGVQQIGASTFRIACGFGLSGGVCWPRGRTAPCGGGARRASRGDFRRLCQRSHNRL